MVNTQQIGNLGNELSTASGLPKAVSEQVIQRSLAEPSWVIPFNTSTFPLYTTGSASAVPVPSSTQTVINASGTGTGSSQDAYTAVGTFYLYGYFVQPGYEINLYLNDGSTRIGYLATGANKGEFPFSSFMPVAQYTAGQKVKVTVSNTATWFLWGLDVS